MRSFLTIFLPFVSHLTIAAEVNGTTIETKTAVHIARFDRGSAAAGMESCKDLNKSGIGFYNPKIELSVREIGVVEQKGTEVTLAELCENLTEFKISLPHHPVYKEPKTYIGFLFADVRAYMKDKLKLNGDTQFLTSFWASDNFSSWTNDADFNSGTAILAWREVGAVADGAYFTPVEKHGDPGPFYLVWDNQEVTYFQKWPFKIVNITLVDSRIEKEMEAIVPFDLAKHKQGYDLTIKNCANCHQINGKGLGGMGPDLAWLGKNRTAENFRIQIRQPVLRMVPFDEGQLSDNDVVSIYEYLRSLGDPQ